MEMEFEKQYIKCSKFQDTEAVIKKAENKIKESRNFIERQYYAQDILFEAETLLSCSNCNDKNPNCLNCRSILLRFIQGHKHLTEDKIKKPSVS